MERMALDLGLGFVQVQVPAEWRDTAGLRMAEPEWR